MTQEFVVRAAALYVPLCGVFGLWLLRPQRKRMGAAVMLGLLWAAVGVAALQAANASAGWWMFVGRGPAVLGMPVELYLGWVLLWGALPVMVFRGSGDGARTGKSAPPGLKPRSLPGLNVWAKAQTYLDVAVPAKHLTVPAKDLSVPAKDAAVPATDLAVPAKDNRTRWPFASLALPVLVFGVFDLVMMPLCAPVVVLSRWWLVGEAVGLVGVFLPGWLLVRATLAARWLALRAALQMVLSGGLFLWLMPEVVFAVRGGSWARALPHGSALGFVAQAIGLLALPGVAAVQEFCERGRGTPIPQDPPQMLVVSGVYRYVANPMQMSCSMVMLVWGCALGSGWVAAVSAISVIYSVGIAQWDEREDLRGRFGEPWVRFRTEVKDWQWRWRPYVPSASEATLYVAATCGVCSEVAAWFAARRPVGLVIVAAEAYPGGSLQRMRYVASDGSYADGVAAFARGLEHLNVAWMLVGAVMRLPVLEQGLQVVADAVGFGPVEIRGGSAHGDETVMNGAPSAVAD